MEERSRPDKDEYGYPILPPMKKTEILERIMTMHWDMKACECWVCTAGRATGCRPREIYLMHKTPLILANMSIER